MSNRWTTGTFLAKARELSRRLQVWHVDDGHGLIHTTSQTGARRWVRLLFREIISATEESTSRPDWWPRGRGLQIFQSVDDQGFNAYLNSGRDTDRSHTKTLMGDFLYQLGNTDPHPALDYLKETFGHILDLPAWAVRTPETEVEVSMVSNGPDEKGEPRCYLVTGRPIPAEYLNALVDAAEKLLTLAPPADGSNSPEAKRPPRQTSINARMMEPIQKHPEAMGWNSQQWAQHLKCAKSTVVETQTWKTLAMGRDRKRAERARDRRRRPKASDGSND